MIVRRHSGYFLSLCLVGLLLAGCGSADPAPSLGDWTLSQDGLSLTEDLKISETEAFFFGAVADVSVRADGQMAVVDPEANDVKVLRPDGSLAHVLGQQGEGPGEFQRVGSAQWARGDSLFVYDPGGSRLTVFAPEPPHPRARTVSLSREDGRPVALYVRGEQFVAGYIHLVPPEEGGQRYQEFRFVGESGTPGDTLLRARRPPIKNASNGEVIQFRPVPFGRETEVAFGPDGRLFSGYQDSLYIEARAPGTSAEPIARVPAPTVPLSSAERDSALAAIDNSELRKAVAKAMPETKSAFTDLVVADNGHLWVRRPMEGPDAETVAWWVLDPEAKTIQEVRLPSDVNLFVVQNARAYGSTTTEVGAPALVRYEVRTPS